MRAATVVLVIGECRFTHYTYAVGNHSVQSIVFATLYSAEGSFDTDDGLAFLTGKDSPGTIDAAGMTCVHVVAFRITKLN